MFVGMQITQVDISSDSTCLRFSVVGARPLYVTALSDCCSNGWFSEVQGADDLRNSTVLAVELSPAQDAPASKQDYDQIMFITIKVLTVRRALHECRITVRNSSNGCYGAGLEYGPPFDVDKLVFTPLKDGVYI